MNYTDDLESYTPGAGLPSGWTSRWDAGTYSVVDDSGDNVIRQAHTSDGRRLASFDAINSDADRNNVEVLCRIRTSNISAGATQLGAAARCSGDGTTENGYVAIIYGDELRITKYVSATATTLITTTTLTIAASTWYWIRFRVNGTSLKARIWDASGGEPGTWDLETTDSSISGTGWAGSFSFSNTTNKDISDIAVATNGDTASMSTAAALAGVATGVATATGVLDATAAALAGAAAGVAAAAAALTTAIPLAGAAQGQAVAAADLNGIQIVTGFDRSNVKVGARTYVTPGSPDVVTVEVRRTDVISDSLGNRALYFRLNGVLGKSPEIRLRVFEDDGVTGHYIGGPPTVERAAYYAFYSEDEGATWAKFTGKSFDSPAHRKYTRSGNFAVDSVLIATTPAWTYAMTAPWIAGLAAAHPTLVGPLASGAGTYIVGTTSSRTDEESRSLGTFSLYGFKISDPRSVVPTAKRKIVLFGGVHAAEDCGNWSLAGLVDWVLSSDASAAALRARADFYIYPLCAPAGRYGGCHRADFDPAGYYDHNRHWHNSTLDSVTKIKAAIATDTGGACHAFFDCHGTISATSNIGGYYETGCSVSLATWKSYLTTYRPTEATNWSASSYAGYSSGYALNTLGAALSLTPEVPYGLGETVADWQSYGADIGKALSDLVVANVLGDVSGVYLAIEGAAAGQVTASATLDGSGAALQGAAISVSAAAAALTTAIQLAGASLVVAGATGTLVSGVPLDGSAITVSAAAGALTAQIRLAGAALGQAAASAGLYNAAALAGAAQEQAAASAILTVEIRLVGAAASAADASGVLTTNISLTAAAIAQAVAQGYLVQDIPLFGVALAAAAGTAALAGGASAVWMKTRAQRLAHFTLGIHRAI